MRAIMKCTAILVGVMGLVTGAAAENRGLSPMVLVSSAAQSQNVKAITFCRDAESLSPDSALNGFSPVSVEFLKKIGAKHGFSIDELKPYRVTLVTPPQHGQVRLTYAPSHGWEYAPTEGYTGADRAIYLVENQRKQYKVVVNFWVVEVIDETRKVQECESIDFGTSNNRNNRGQTTIPLSLFRRNSLTCNA